eukprot:CAMPEP_0170348670 /NCGR_PEP_ID=MMETSP0116_2-20130129/75613_1 /TAXON_ID=400756 /ORGANISM="Durinskia baltica, Strain CSIRO CS-38" /LENGTH=37 /DNA_ID= /DNA_START= /DNA_END= /DNA_ORIENTATION=
MRSLHFMRNALVMGVTTAWVSQSPHPSRTSTSTSTST